MLVGFEDADQSTVHTAITIIIMELGGLLCVTKRSEGEAWHRLMAYDLLCSKQVGSRTSSSAYICGLGRLMVQLYA